MRPEVMLNSIRSLFNNPTVRRIYVRLRVPLAIIAIAAVFPFLRRDWLLAGFIVSMFGEFIQLWSFASLDKNSDLAIRGPYAMVRNPMYLGRYFILLGLLMLLGAWWILVLYTVAYWFYMDTRVEREEAHLRPIFGPRYDEYCAKVRRFVPGVPLAGQPVAYWNWTLFRQNNAAMNLLGTLVVWALVAAWLLLR
ncbi:MAG TPA: isoprenylcysteine carboxylmethyltransferase family protein [Burkholderiaceae bacterium]|nr:isoprenylcysteine carboxylmethyltransferase family protein [Burkholderiaceae bacterium]HQR69376.1 isoprenylcysteine carboxylmethyltransferase family protein [Burkholderiaceae bacterium]